MSVESEIDLIRIYIDRIAVLVDARKEISEDDLKALNTLSNMTQSLTNLIRTHYITRGKGGAVLQTIEDALEEIRLEMGL